MAVDEVVGPFVHPLFTQPEGLENGPQGRDLPGHGDMVDPAAHFPQGLLHGLNFFGGNGAALFHVAGHVHLIAPVHQEPDVVHIELLNHGSHGGIHQRLFHRVFSVSSMERARSATQ